MPNLKELAEIEVKIRCRQHPEAEIKSLADLLKHCMDIDKMPMPSQWDTQEVLMAAVTKGRYP